MHWSTWSYVLYPSVFTPIVDLLNKLTSIIFSFVYRDRLLLLKYLRNCGERSRRPLSPLFDRLLERERERDRLVLLSSRATIPLSFLLCGLLEQDRLPSALLSSVSDVEVDLRLGSAESSDSISSAALKY